MPSLPPRSILLFAACAFGGALCFNVPVRADDAPEPPRKGAITISVSKADAKIKALSAGTSGSGGKSSKGGYGANGDGGGKGGTMTPTGYRNLNEEADVTYAITVKNSSHQPVKNLAVEYHFYNKTVRTTDGISDPPKIDDITSVENVDIDPGKSTDILTQPIPNASNASSSIPASAARSKTRTSPSQSSTITNLVGWHIEVRFNDQVVAKTDEPFDLKDRLDQINKQVQMLTPKK